MRVILCEHVGNLGEMGDTVKVADGYARNYLIPRKLAVSVDSASAKQIEHELRIIKKREAVVRSRLQDQAQEIEKLTLDFTMRAGEGGKLFGSVTSAMIAERLRELGHEVDRRKVELEESIKELGIFTVPAGLGSGVTAGVKVWVQPEQETEEVSLEEQVEAIAAAEQSEAKEETGTASGTPDEEKPAEASASPEA